MAMKTFKGRPCLAGEVEGKAAVSSYGFKPCSSWIDILFQGMTLCQPHRLAGGRRSDDGGRLA